MPPLPGAGIDLSAEGAKKGASPFAPGMATTICREMMRCILLRNPFQVKLQPKATALLYKRRGAPADTGVNCLCKRTLSMNFMAACSIMSDAVFGKKNAAAENRRTCCGAGLSARQPLIGGVAYLVAEDEFNSAVKAQLLS